MSEAVETQTLEQTLNKTDFGHLVYEYRKVFVGFVVAILVGVAGYVLWKQAKQSTALKRSVEVFEFQSKTWADAKAGKVTPEQLVKTFEGLDQEVLAAPVMLPVALEMSKFLFDKGLLKEAMAVLSKVKADQPLATFFVNTQKAVIAEKAGNVDEAIAALEALASDKDGLMPARVSVELGRLYLGKGDKGRAQTQFDHVLNTYPNDEAAKLAKLYLAQLAK